jgi:WD40 repeat protein
MHGSQRGLEVRSWPGLKPIAKLQCELSHVHDLAFSPDGKILLAAGGSPAQAGAIEALRWPGGARIRRIDGFKDLVYQVAWSPDGNRWAAASGDGTCRVFAADSGKELLRYEGHSRPVLAIAFLPDGNSVVSAGVDQSIQLWEWGTGKLIRTLDNHTGTVNDLALRPSQAEDKMPVLASASEDRTVRLWQPTIGRMLRFVRLESIPRVIAWSPEGDRLIAGCSDGKVRVLDPDTLAILRELRVADGRIHCVAIAGQGHVGVAAGVAAPAKFGWK